MKFLFICSLSVILDLPQFISSLFSARIAQRQLRLFDLRPKSRRLYSLTRLLEARDYRSVGRSGCGASADPTGR